MAFQDYGKSALFTGVIRVDCLAVRADQFKHLLAIIADQCLIINLNTAFWTFHNEIIPRLKVLNKDYGYTTWMI